VGTTSIHTCRSYDHTLHNIPQTTWSRQLEHSLHALADSSDFGVLGDQSSSKWEIPCLGCRLTTMQNLSSVEKSVTVQANTQTNSNRYISTPCLSACVDNNVTYNAHDVEEISNHRHTAVSSVDLNI